MNFTYTMRQGDTAKQKFTLKNKGQALDITGFAGLSFHFKSSEDESVTVDFDTLNTNVFADDASNGAVSFKDVSSNLVQAKSPYFGYVLLVDSDGRHTFPQDGFIELTVLDRYTES